jgi:hypothetical protein
VGDAGLSSLDIVAGRRWVFYCGLVVASNLFSSDPYGSLCVGVLGRVVLMAGGCSGDHL